MSGPSSFTGVMPDLYWSSTHHLSDTMVAWVVNLSNANDALGGKTGSFYVWPVRGGQ